MDSHLSLVAESTRAVLTGAVFLLCGSGVGHTHALVFASLTSPWLGYFVSFFGIECAFSYLNSQRSGKFVIFPRSGKLLMDGIEIDNV